MNVYERKPTQPREIKQKIYINNGEYIICVPYVFEERSV